MDYLAAMRAYLRTVELGSFTKAAASLGAKVSTISRQIAALEADMGVALLNRSTRGLHLTEAGREFQVRSAAIVAGLEEARQATSALNSRPQGLLRISLPGAFGRLRVMPAMADFLATHPRIRAEVSFSDERIDLVATGTDVAVRIGVLPDPRRPQVTTPSAIAYAAGEFSLSRPDVAAATPLVLQIGGTNRLRGG